MTEQVKTTKEPEVIEVQKTGEEGKTSEEKTLGDVLQTSTKKVEEPKKEPETVGLDKFLSEKKARKEAEKRIKELEEKIEDGADDDEISDDIDSIADEFGVDKKFLKKLERAMEAKQEAKIDARVSEKIKPMEEKDKESKMDKVFGDAFEKVMEKLPEYKNIVNQDVIKTLALQKSNSTKTLSQLIEETYGNALSGKRTIETTTPRGGKEPQEIDFTRAAKEPAYFKEIMADPELKKQYNSNLERRISF